MKNDNLPILICLALALGFQVSNLQAQKLPSVQKTNIYAPADIKVDGKATEWNDKFEAMNGATSVFYTMANDADNLYLTIQVTDGATMSKLIGGGYKLTIKGADKAAKPVVISGMLLQPAARVGVTQKLKNKDLNTDSLIKELDIQIAKNMKETGVSGVKEIPDTLISVYNEYGIKQAARFDTKRALTCELAIPLKYVAHLIIGGTFKYNFTLTGLNMNSMQIVLNGKKQDAGSLSTMPASSGVSMLMNGAMGGDFQTLFNPTDFSGSYTLAKK